QETTRLAALLADYKRTTPQDKYWEGHSLAVKGNTRLALEKLQRATQADPENFSAWFVRGNCYADLLRYGEAAACFNVCVALRPDFAQCWYSRGLAHAEGKNFRQAIEDYSRAISLQSDLVDAFISRGVAHRELNEISAGIADFNRALDLPGCPNKVYVLR